MIGTTATIPYEFKDDNLNYVEITNPAIQFYDINHNKIGDKISLELNEYKLDIGRYIFYFEVPDLSPYFYLECSGTIDSKITTIRDTIDTYFANDEMNIGTAPTITKGVDSYVTLEEAENIAINILNAESWYETNEDNKIRALVLATQHIDSLILRGISYTKGQVLAFPRVIRNINNSKITTDENKIMKATVYEAIEILKNDNQTRESLQYQGVKSFDIGDLSENLTIFSNKLYSIEAYRLLKPYIAGTIVIK
jgi:hypothetical protein